MTDIEWEAMGLWKWVAFLDRTEFSKNAKLWFKSNFSINMPPLWANAKSPDLSLNIKSACRKNKFPPQQR